MKVLKRKVSVLIIAITAIISFMNQSSTAKAASPYALYVNRVANVVTVMTLDEQGQYTVPVRAFLCSVGANIEDTPAGVFTTSEYYEWRKLFGNTYGRYAIRFNGHILFHSVPYNAPTVDSLRTNAFNQLGEGASAGCVRMSVGDLKWIYDNCPKGTPVVVYDSENPGPLGKPASVKVDESTGLGGYDPTELAAYNPWINVNPIQYLKQDSGDNVIHGYVGLNAEGLEQWIGAKNPDGSVIETWNYSLEINGNYDPYTSGTYTVWVTARDNNGRASVAQQYTIVL